MTSSLTRPLAPALLVAALALSACSGEEEAAFVESASASPSQAPDASAETDAVTQESAAAAGVDLSDISNPIAAATAPAQVRGDPEATMDVRLLSLTRDGQTLIGIFSFTVNSELVDEETASLFGYLGNAFWTPYLVDATNLTRHDVLSGEGGVQTVTDSAGVRFSPGQTLFGYAAFAAPPEDITSVTVSLVDSAPAAVNVPIQ